MLHNVAAKMLHNTMNSHMKHIQSGPKDKVIRQGPITPLTGAVTPVSLLE